jgi:Flp pilus assembly protein TadG
MKSMRRFLKQFLCRQEGNVMIITGLMALTLVAVGGASIDLGRQQLVRNKLQQATDAGAVAAATLPDGTTNAVRQAAAERYYALNFPDGYLGVARPAPSVSISNSSVDVTANAVFTPRFVSLLGVNRMTSTGDTGVNRDVTVTASSYDLITVMDVSGSMVTADAGGVSRIAAQRSAANTIAGSLLNPNTTSSRVASVTWSDAVVNALGFQSTYGPVRSFNDAMNVVAGTNSTVGLQRARTLASGFRSEAVKAVVLITDGFNGANVAPYSTYAINRASLTECQALKDTGAVVYTIAFGSDVTGQCYTYQCPPGKCKGSGSITVPKNQNDPELCAKPFLQTCATSPANYFEAPNPTELNQAFQAILTSIQNMRVVR